MSKNENFAAFLVKEYPNVDIYYHFKEKAVLKLSVEFCELSNCHKKCLYFVAHCICS